MKNIIAADVISFLAEKGTSHLGSLCRNGGDGASGPTLPEAHCR